MNLSSLGWPEEWAAQLQVHGQDKLVRITTRHKKSLRAVAADGHELNCYLPGKLQMQQRTAAELPVVGDWCVIGPEFTDASAIQAAMITEILPRRSKISRLAAGREAEEQVLAANVDYCFIVTSANRDFNVKRLQRYVLIARQGNVQPVIVLSKIDVCEDPAVIEQALQESFADVLLIKTSMPHATGLPDILAYLKPGKTGVFIGSSGVGKSTLVNVLLGGAVQKIAEIRATDERGRHTTSAALLLSIPGGGMIIDTPGLREIQVFGDESAVEQTFEKLHEFGRGCKFRDCTHTTEPGCAVLIALQDGRLEQDEYDNHRKLLQEIGHANRQVEQRSAAKEKKHGKQVKQGQRKQHKSKDKNHWILDFAHS
jgi:ribosome biogenesis GTPase